MSAVGGATLSAIVPELRRRALAANLELAKSGLVTLTFGNVSVADRGSGLMAIKPSGVPYPDLREEAIPVLDIQRGAVIAGTARPSSDTPTHLVLYRAFSEIGGVVHTHSPFATAWAQARRAIPCFGTTHADHFRGSVPVTRSLTPEEIGGNYEHETGALIVETLRELGLTPLAMPATLVASHGPFVWGSDGQSAVANAIALEMVAVAAYQTMGLCEDAAEISAPLLARHFDRKHGTGAYYGQPS